MSPNSLIVLIGLLLSLASPALADAKECLSCHPLKLTDRHGLLGCSACHAAEQNAAHAQGSSGARAACRRCHPQMAGILNHAMATRAPERDLVAATFGRHDPQFFSSNCTGCHVQGCNDCHGTGHQISRPANDICLQCHKGGKVGWDYLGRAPREDSLRYQRGPQAQGEFYLAMRPDIHAEAGMVCADCHTMSSLLAGKKSSKRCQDCHQPDLSVIEHGIPAHLTKLECYACHSAWSPQEYGSFYLRMIDTPARDFFYVRQNPASDTIKSAYLKLQEAPPLGLNSRGLLSPIRPLIGYYSNIVAGEPVGVENRLVIAGWQPFFPHTVRRGTVMCEQCHNNPRRFLLEAEEKRIYRPDLDGLGLSSFWNRSGQTMRQGAFVPPEKVEALRRKSPAYIKAYIQKWQKFINRVDPSSSSSSE